MIWTLGNGLIKSGRRVAVAESNASRGKRARPRNPQGTPLEAAGAMGADHSFTLQAVMELREATGGMKTAVETLSKQVEQQQRTIRWMARVLWMAGGALLVLSPIAGWLINHRFDEILNALAKDGG